MTTHRIAGFALACLFAAGACAQVSAPTPLRVITFDGGWNLPLWAAQRQGFFEANGVAVQYAYTPSSGFLVASLLDGKSDIALALIDNLVAYQEGQGEAAIPDRPDLFAFMGGDSGFLSVIAAPGIGSLADLKGKTLSVDAMTTGAAFVLREIIARSGIAEADVDYVRAYRAAVDWLYDRANRDVVEALLVANGRDMTPALARQSYDLLLADKGGIARDLAIDPAGMRTVLQLRSKYGTPQKALSDPAKYIDLTYYDKAFGTR